MSQHQIDPKKSTSAMATGSDDDEWVYLDGASGVAHCGGSVVIALASDVATEENEVAYSDEEAYLSDYSNEGRLKKVYESDEGLDGFSEDDDDSGSNSDDEACLSDYSNEGRLEKVYESDEDLDEVSVEDDDSGSKSNSDEEAYLSDYSGEGLLEKVYESDEDLDEVSVEDNKCGAASQAYSAPCKVDSSGSDDYSDYSDDYSDYSNEDRLEKVYESDEDLDEVSEDDDDDDSGSNSDEEAYISDYSGEGRLKKVYESDEDLDELSVDADNCGAMAYRAPWGDTCSESDDWLDYSDEDCLETVYQYYRDTGEEAGGGGAPGSYYDLDDPLDSSLNAYNDYDFLLERAMADAYLSGYRDGSDVGRHYGYGQGEGYGYSGDRYHAGLLQPPAYRAYYVPGVGSMYPPYALRYPYYAAQPASRYGGYPPVSSPSSWARLRALF